MATEHEHAVTDAEVAAQLGDLVSRLSRRLRRSSTQRLLPFGLNDGQARALRIVGRTQPPLHMSDIARRIEIVPRSATTVIEGLEAKGLVVRAIDPEDRRSILVRVTVEGSRLLAELDRARNEAALAMFGHIDRARRIQLLRLLGTVDGSYEPTRARRGRDRVHTDAAPDGRGRQRQ